MSTERPLLPPLVAGEPVTEDQAAWLDGFFAGVKNAALTFAEAEPTAGPQPLEAPPAEEKLTAEERIKRDCHPFDAFPKIRQHARTNAAPGKEDIFRFKWNGLFWLGPVHEGYMCRLRIPAGQVSSAQFFELASIADDLASGYLQITTRNNVQIRVVQPKDAPELLRRIQDCGLHSRGAGADNLRNFTASPTAGVDPHELIDVTPHAKDLAHYVVNHLEFYDLPRKFNVSFDGGGLVGVAEDTNDIGLRAIRISPPPVGHPLEGKVEGGVWFQVLLGGVTGHREFAEDSGVLCRPGEATDVVAALTRVFIRHGNRENRGRARLIHLIREWGVEKVLAEAEALLGWKLTRFDPALPDHAALVEIPEKPVVAHPHVGVHPQKQAGLNWLGVYVPVGLLQTDEARAIARIAREFGSGELRLTIFQNLIIPNIPDDRLEAAQSALAAAGLRWEASFIRGGVAACTGNRHCKFANADTKGNALGLVDFLDERITLDAPINIHVTGCPHSCAQHYIGDIGLLACKVQPEGAAAPVEGYHVFVGGGFGANRRLGRQLFKSVAAGEDLNRRILALLTVYLERRVGRETFLDFTTRHEIADLEALTLGNLSEGEISPVAA